MISKKQTTWSEGADKKKEKKNGKPSPKSEN